MKTKEPIDAISFDRELTLQGKDSIGLQYWVVCLTTHGDGSLYRTTKTAYPARSWTHLPDYEKKGRKIINILTTKEELTKWCREELYWDEEKLSTIDFWVGGVKYGGI